MVSYVCDADGRITYISPQIEEWTGLPARAVDRGPEALAGDAASRRPRARGRGRLRRRHARHRVPHARPRRDVALGLGARGQGPGQTGSQGICLDITALREAQEALEAAARAARRRRQRRAGDPVRRPTPTGVITLSEGKALRDARASSRARWSALDLRRACGRRLAAGDARRALAGESFETPRRRSATASSTATWRAHGGRLDDRHLDRRHRAPALRGAARPPRLPRPAHRAAEPRNARGAARARPGPRPARGRRASPRSTSTSTASSSSTTRSATRPATSVLREVAQPDPRRHPRRRPGRPARRRRVHARAARA